MLASSVAASMIFDACWFPSVLTHEWLFMMIIPRCSLMYLTESVNDFVGIEFYCERTPPSLHLFILHWQRRRCSHPSNCLPYQWVHHDFFFLLISSYTISVSFSIHSLSPVPLGKDCSNLISINSLSDSTHLYVGIINKDIVIEYEIKKKKYTEKVYSYSLSISLVCWNLISEYLVHSLHHSFSFGTKEEYSWYLSEWYFSLFEQASLSWFHEQIQMRTWWWHGLWRFTWCFSWLWSMFLSLLFTL